VRSFDDNEQITIGDEKIVWRKKWMWGVGKDGCGG
jgi:hypothetical protein